MVSFRYISADRRGGRAERRAPLAHATVAGVDADSVGSAARGRGRALPSRRRSTTTLVDFVSLDDDGDGGRERLGLDENAREQLGPAPRPLDGLEGAMRLP